MMKVDVFRASVSEFIFSGLSSHQVEDAERAAVSLFGNEVIPSNMISSYIRWRDKVLKMPMMMDRQNNPIYFFVTESTDAQKLKWTVHHYDPPEASHPEYERLPVRAAFASDSATGKASTISLLVALESHFLVATTSSN
jgi:hypothetical protein